MINKYTKSLIISLLLFFVAASKVSASEGIFELNSTQGKEMRCFAVSIQMADRNYNILISCRDIVYPALPNQDQVFRYVVWATDLENEKPFRLGAIGLGRASFKTKKRFEYLFVTTESAKKPKSPSNNVVMEGYLESIPLLESSVSPDEDLDRLLEESDEEQVATEKETAEEKQASTRQRVVKSLRRAGLIIFIVLITMIGLIFVITRTRR